MSEKRWFWLGMAVLSVLTIRAAWIAPYLPTNDGPQHVLSTHIENHYADPDQPIYASTLVPAPQFAYKGFSAIYGPLEKSLGWRDGLRVALAILVVGFAWSFAAAVLAFEAKRRFVAYAGFVLAWMWPLYMGFFAHVVGTAIGVAVLAYAVRAKTFDAKRISAVLAGFLVQSVAHLFTAALAWCVLAVLLVARADRADRKRTVAVVALFAAPPAGILAAASQYPGLFAPAHPTSLAERATVLPHILAPGPSWRAWIVLAIVACAAALGASRFRKIATLDRAALVVGIGLLACSVILPRDMNNWQFFAPRLAPVGAVLVLVAAPVEKMRAAVTGGVAFVLAAASLLVSGGFNRALYDQCADALGGLDGFRRSFVSLPIVLDAYCVDPPSPAESPVPYLAPLGQIGALYAAAQGGTVPYLFVGSPAVHAFLPRKDAPLPVIVPDPEAFRAVVSSPRFRDDDAFRKRTLRDHLWPAMQYEGIIVAGLQPRDLELVEEQGFSFLYQRGSFGLARFVPCGFTVRAPLDVNALDVEAKLPDGAGPAATLAAAPVGPGQFAIQASPCGELAIRVHPHDGAQRCRGSDGAGWMRTTIPRSGANLDCEAAQ